MLNINVRTPGVKQQIRRLDRIQKQQVPFALANTINDLLFEGRKAETSAMQRHLHKPTPFTKRGLRVDKANKRNLRGVLEIPDNRWKYMQYQVEGGTDASGASVPVNAKTKASGSMGRGGVARLLKRKNVTVMRFKGKSGVYQVNKDGSVKLLVHFANRATYRPIYPFGQALAREVDRKAETLMQKNLARALRTAR